MNVDESCPLAFTLPCVIFFLLMLIPILIPILLPQKTVRDLDVLLNKPFDKTKADSEH